MCVQTKGEHSAVVLDSIKETGALKPVFFF